MAAVWHYAAPLRDLRFVIEELLDLPRAWAALPAFAELDRDTAREVLAQAARFAAEVLAPLNARGDLEGCTLLADGSVRTPAGFREAYRAFVEGGWPSLSAPPAIGGQGLPQVLDAALYEMLVAANHGWTMYPALLHGAVATLHAHASDALKERYLAKLVSGEWLPTMCLTEPQAGSDLGLVRTRAEAQPDGSFRLHGQKIFISSGEHDLTDNIVHLVLARITGAPPGTKGLTLFVAPRLLPDGARNALSCTGLEAKMGIHGSATCAMSLDGATGWVVGEPNRGLAAMFVMMNAARLHVAVQGLGQAELAHQNALRYAHERLQMRAVARPAGAAADPPADPIVLHPPMRRTLIEQRVWVEGARMLALEAAHGLDLAGHASDATVRERSLDRVSIATPVLKAFLSDRGFAVASAALQVFGGHGYLHDWGIEQCLRDARIAMIYEGTNEIQAIDLLTRKVQPDGGAKFGALLDDLAAALPAHAEHAPAARDAVEALRRATATLLAGPGRDAETAHRVAGDFLHATALVMFAQAWARADAVAQAAMPADPAFYRAKRDSARFFFDDLLPELALRLGRLAPKTPLPYVDLPPS